MNILHASTDPNLLTRLKEMLGSADRADIAVGYFFMSGFEAVADELLRLNRTRILVGRTDRPTLEAVAAGLQQARPLEAQLNAARTIPRRQRQAAATDTATGISGGIASMAQTDENQAAVERLQGLVTSGLLEVRAYPREFLHAKAYLCWYDNHAEPGAAIVGSSNFTLAGFTGNTELNVRVTGDDGDGRTFPLVRGTVGRLGGHQHSGNPNRGKQLGSPPVPPIPRLPEGPLRALRWTDRQRRTPAAGTHPPRGAWPTSRWTRSVAGWTWSATTAAATSPMWWVFGKSFIGAELLRQLRQSYPNDGNPLIICPAGLVPMWEGFNERYQLGAAVLSQSRIAAPPQLVFNPETADYEEADASQHGILLAEEYPHRGAVLVDEAHGFRNDNQRSRGLRDYLERGDHKVILLSATPQNLGPRGHLPADQPLHGRDRPRPAH